MARTFSNQESIALQDPKIKLLEADYQLNIFSQQILKSHILDKFKNRAFNIHNGKLLQYVGIHVHQWAIPSGETESCYELFNCVIANTPHKNFKANVYTGATASSKVHGL